jgi:glycosyltransferase involved in cell wall biosynthesis
MMRKNRKVILHVGPGISSKGGVAAVLKLYADHASLFERSDYLVRFSASCGQHGVAGIYQFVLAWMHIIVGALAGGFYIVHIHTSIRGSLARKWIIAMSCLALRQKYIIHIHSGAMADYVEKLGGIGRFATRLMFSRAYRVICISEQMRKWVIESKRTDYLKCVLIYNGVCAPEREFLKEKKNRVTPKIVFLGKISAAKGVPTLIEAAKLLEVSGRKYELSIAGNGDIEGLERNIKKKALSNNVKYVGWVDGRSKSELLAGADIFVLPSRSEGFPVSIVEAMAFGLAIISTNISGVTDAIRDKIDGLLVDVDNSEKLHNALVLVLDDYLLRYKLAKSARQRFEDNFTISASISKLIDVYNRSSHFDAESR